MNRIKEWTKALILSIFFFAISTSTSNAEVNIGQLQGYLNGVVNPQHVYKANNPKFSDWSQSEEFIDPITGALAIKETDITLPGKDGLDLAIERIYNSAQSELGTKRVEVTSSSTYREEYYSAYYITFLYYIPSTGGVYTEVSGGYGQLEDAWNIAISRFSSDDRVLDFTIEDRGRYTVYETYTVRTLTWPDKYNYLRSRYDLGLGWSFAFPSVQTENESGKQYIHFHDGNGETYKVSLTPDTTDSNLENYQGKDVQFNEDNGTYNNGLVSSKYVFMESDQRKSYFAEDGRLIGIKDRFGNEIKFTHVDRMIHGKNYPFISQITDSIGRTVDFQYENTLNQSTSENLTLTIRDPAKTETLTINYNKQRVAATRQDTGETYYEPRLYRVTNPEGYETTYGYEFDESKSRFLFDRKDLTQSAYTRLALLTTIYHPHSKSSYIYETVQRNLGPEGAYDGYRIKERFDQELRYNPADNKASGSGDYNHVNYQYFKLNSSGGLEYNKGDYTGYPEYYSEEGLPETYQYGSEATILSSGLKTRTIFNGKKQEIKTESSAPNGESRTINHQEYDSTWKFKPTKSEIEDKSSKGSSKLYTARTYNDWGGLASETLPITQDQMSNSTTKQLYTHSYQYDPTFKFVTQKQGYQKDGVPLTETFTYDTLGRLTSSTNAKGEQINYSYSKPAAGEVVTKTQALDSGKVAKIEIIFGPEAKFAYPTVIREYYTDQNNNLTSTQTTMSYNLLMGLVSTETDNSGNGTSYQYDKLGRVTSIKYPNFTETGSTTTYSVEDLYEYSLSGVPTNKFDSNSLYLVAEGVLSKTQYKNLSTGQVNDFNERNTNYDGFGNLRYQELWDYKGGQWIEEASYYYDSLARPLYFVDAEGNRSTYEYDAWGNTSKTVDPLGNTYRTDLELYPRKRTTYLVEGGTGAKQNVVEENLDQWGRVIEKKAYPSWPTTTPVVSETFTYDVVGNALSYRNPNGDTSTYTYDKLNQLTQVRDALNQVTGYSYTTLGKLKSITLSDGTKTWVSSKEYDELGQLRKNITPSSQIEQFVPNALGQLVQRTDPKGQVFTYTYDTHDRQTAKNGATSSLAYTYYSPFGESWIEQFSNSNLVRLLGTGYNALGQVDYTILYNEIYQHETTYSYDKVGNLTSVRNPFSFHTLYGYNKNRVTRVQTDGSATANTADEVNALYEYELNGLVKSITYPKLKDGTYLKATFEYDDLGRLKKATNTKGTEVLSEYSYSHDANGNITGVTDASGTTTYLYDKLDRLIEVQRPNGSLSKYTYDVRGNRSTVKDDTWSINLEDTDYTFNERDQLTEILTGTSYGGYQYGPLDLRTKKKTLTEEVRYHYNLNDQVIAESNASNAVIANYIWGPDRVLAMKDANGNEYYYLFNGHDDVVQMVDTNGTVVNQYHYDEWGNILSKEEQVRNPFKYAGEINDEESGLYYLRARYYDPSVGRFINKDTYEGDIANPLSLNLYTYVHNNPLIYVDPTGNWCTSADKKWSHPGNCSSKGSKFTLDAAHNGSPIISNGKKVGTYYWDEEDAKSPDSLLAGTPLEPIEYLINPGKKVAGKGLNAGLNVVNKAASKAINLPSYKKVSIDIRHIMSGHSKTGGRAAQSGMKDLFPSNMSQKQIEDAIRNAYRNGKKIKTQGDKVKVQGNVNGIMIEMWINTKTKVIETAYPKD